MAVQSLYNILFMKESYPKVQSNDHNGTLCLKLT